MADSNSFEQIETDDGLPDWSAMSTQLNSVQAFPHPECMKSEDARLKTFSNWPSWSPVQPHDLVQAGMFYVPESNRQEDRVQCFCCAGMLVNWEEGDDPWQEHARVYPDCLFILGHDVGNIPSTQPRQRSSAHNSSMESFEERLESFRDRVHPINPERLARAGFSSIGDRDCVVCFKCGGRLKNWQPDEDPWEEHAKHYPGCSFLLAEKGQEFINSVQLRTPGRSSSNGFFSRERASNVLQSESREDYSTVEDLVVDITVGVFDSDSDMCRDTLNEDPLKKLEKLQREKLCKVCMDSDIAIVFIPCKHLVTCKKCSEPLCKCPICCADITQKIKTFCS
ncbi:E3 ubiquitin-protein ligase XIAP isoform X2 [Ictalurus furcatus]|uniref:E3 ubiquitin-protein ligase XIAP isoform X2 n=1 Tax=Ictalurus furcatus TaxID=66913 RepID=UPI002350F75F|nr:E3 ubiquitin-protein ligase XIAP isoform X2 [Ictalurus furcatus]